MDEVTASMLAPFNLKDWLSSGQSYLSQFGHLSSYSKITWVFACVNRTANSVANVPRTIKDNGKPIDKNHPLWPYFNPPYGKLIPTFNHLVKVSVIQKEIFGATFWVFNEKDETIFPTWHGAMAPLIVPNTTNLIGWEFTLGTTKTRYRLDQVFWWRYPHPTVVHAAMAPLDAARWALEQEVNQSAWNANSFKRGLSSKILAYSPDGISKRQRDQILKDVQDQSTGIVGSEFMVLTGKFNLEKISQSLKDMEYIQGRQMTREEICAVFQVPPALVGIYQYANYANAEFQGSEFWQHKILPMLTEFKETFELHMQMMGYENITIEFDQRYYIDFIKPLKDRTESAKNLYDIGVPTQEALRISDIEADTHALEGGTPDPLPSQVDPEDPNEPDTPDQDTPDQNNYTVRGKEPIPSDLNEYAWTVLEGEILPDTNAFVSVFKERVLMDIKREKEQFQIYYDVWQSQLETIIEDHLQDFISAGWNVTLAQLGKADPNIWIKNISTMFDPPAIDPDTFAIEVRPLMKELAGQYSVVSNSMAKDIELRVWAMMSRGDSIADIEKSISEVLTSPNWSRRIARTVVGGGYNTGKYMGYLDQGTAYHKWLSMMDGIERTTHHREHGNIVPVRQQFPVTKLRYPHDPQGSIKEIAGCRCTTEPVTGAKPSNKFMQWFSASSILGPILKTIQSAYYSFRVAGWRVGKKMAYYRAKAAGQELASNLRNIFTGSSKVKIDYSGTIIKQASTKSLTDLAKQIQTALTPLTLPGLDLTIKTTSKERIRYSNNIMYLPESKLEQIIEVFNAGDFSIKADPEGFLPQMYFCLGQHTELKVFAEQMKEYYEQRISKTGVIGSEEIIGVPGIDVQCPDNNFSLAFLGVKPSKGTLLTGHVFSMLGASFYDEYNDFDLGIMFLRDTKTFIKVIQLFGDAFDES